MKVLMLQGAEFRLSRGPDKKWWSYTVRNGASHEDRG